MRVLAEVSGWCGQSGPLLGSCTTLQLELVRPVCRLVQLLPSVRLSVTCVHLKANQRNNPTQKCSLLHCVRRWPFLGFLSLAAGAV